MDSTNGLSDTVRKLVRELRSFWESRIASRSLVTSETARSSVPMAAAGAALSAALAAATDILAIVSESAAAAASAPEEREEEAFHMSCFANSTSWRRYPYISFHPCSPVRKKTQFHPWSPVLRKKKPLPILKDYCLY